MINLDALYNGSDPRLALLRHNGYLYDLHVSNGLPGRCARPLRGGGLGLGSRAEGSG